MTCWFCGTPTFDPPAGTLVVNGQEIARICAKHAPMTAVALRGVAGFRHFARVWVENRAAAGAAAAKATAVRSGETGVPGNGRSI